MAQEKFWIIPSSGVFRAVKTFLTTLLIQTLYLPFVFWFIELGQNEFTKLVTGEYDWHYPTSPYHHFYFKSLLSWVTCVVVFWSLYYWLFIPKRVGFWKRIAVTTIVGWVSEWWFGYLAPITFGHQMQVWPNTPLRYVSFGAIGWWFLNSLVFYTFVFLFPKAMGDIIHQYEVTAAGHIKN